MSAVVRSNYEANLVVEQSNVREKMVNDSVGVATIKEPTKKGKGVVVKENENRDPNVQNPKVEHPKV